MRHAVYAHVCSKEFAERVGDWNFDWTQLGASQFFLNFFITFYNGHCYGRFLRRNCCQPKPFFERAHCNREK
eukprot:2145582-Amphidinium_carterae.2